MSGEIVYKANAKVNLFLDAVSKRDDGYHNLVSIVQRVGLCDRLTFKRIGKANYFKLACEQRHIPTDEKNLVYRAFLEMKKRFSHIDGVFFGLDKKIPVSAGLGGGSSDCAAALLALREQFSLPVTDDELCSIAKGLGADVPFFIRGNTALAEGVGEKLSYLSGVPRMHFLLVRPPIIVSTPSVFQKLDLNALDRRRDASLALKHLAEGDIAGLCSQLYNALESVTAREYPIIEKIKSELCACGALGAMMSGSGPTVFGIFPTRGKAVGALKHIKSAFPEIKEIFATTSVCKDNAG